MNPETPLLGSCPRCGKDIPQYNQLVKYETRDGITKIWAECTNCSDVIAPEK